MSSNTIKISSDGLTEDYVVLVPLESTDKRAGNLTSNTDLQSLYYDYSIVGYYPELRIAAGTDKNGDKASKLKAGDSLTFTLYDSEDSTLSGNSEGDSFSIIIADATTYKPVAFNLAVADTSTDATTSTTTYSYSDITISSSDLKGMAGALKFMQSILAMPFGNLAVSYNKALYTVYANYSTAEKESNYIGTDANIDQYIDDYYSAVTGVLTDSGVTDYLYTTPWEILTAQSYFYNFAIAWLPNDLSSSLIYSLSDEDGSEQGYLLTKVADSATGIEITKNDGLFGISMTYYGADADPADLSAATGTTLEYSIGLFSDTDNKIALQGSFLYSNNTFAKYSWGSVDGINCSGSALDYSSFSDATNTTNTTNTTDTTDTTDEDEKEMIEEFHALEPMIWISGFTAVGGIALVTIGNINNISTLISRSVWRYKYNQYNQRRRANNDDAISETEYIEEFGGAPEYTVVSTFGDLFGNIASRGWTWGISQADAQNNVNNNSSEVLENIVMETVQYSPALDMDTQIALERAGSAVKTQNTFSTSNSEELSMGQKNTVDYLLNVKTVKENMSDPGNSNDENTGIELISNSPDALLVSTIDNGKSLKTASTEITNGSVTEQLQAYIGDNASSNISAVDFCLTYFDTVNLTGTNNENQSKDEFEDLDEVP